MCCMEVIKTRMGTVSGAPATCSAVSHMVTYMLLILTGHEPAIISPTSQMRNQSSETSNQP